MSQLETYLNLEKRAKEHLRNSDKAKGALEQIEQTLIKEFDCNLTDAIKLLSNKKEKLQYKKNELEEKLTSFNKQYKDL